jgi:hypothetical protein
MKAQNNKPETKMFIECHEDGCELEAVAKRSKLKLCVVHREVHFQKQRLETNKNFMSKLTNSKHLIYDGILLYYTVNFSSKLIFVFIEQPYTVDYNTGFGVLAIQNRTEFWNSSKYKKAAVETMQQLAIFDTRQQYETLHMYTEELICILSDFYHSERLKYCVVQPIVRHELKLRFVAQSASTILTSLNILANTVVRTGRKCNSDVNGIVLQVHCVLSTCAVLLITVHKTFRCMEIMEVVCPIVWYRHHVTGFSLITNI